MAKGSRDELVSEPPLETLEASVVVPVRNEEARLPAVLCSLAEQKTVAGHLLPYDSYEIILLINNTRDRSRDVAETFKRVCPFLQLHIVERQFANSRANVGNVRRLLMNEACRRLEISRGSGKAILTTDADTRVAPNWISQNQQELRAGADVVGGRVVVLPFERETLDSATLALHRYDHLYRRLICWLEHRFDARPYDPWPRHHQHFGASLAITPEVYRAVGRLPRKPFYEDVALYDELVRHDARIRHSNKVRVFTSARVSGRAPFGLSSQLAGWKRCRNRGLFTPVESGEFLEHLFAARRILRTAWLECRDSADADPAKVEELASLLGMNRRRLVYCLRAGQHFGIVLDRLKFYERIRETWPDKRRLVPLKQAVDELFAAFQLTRKDRRSSPAPEDMLIPQLV